MPPLRTAHRALTRFAVLVAVAVVGLVPAAQAEAAPSIDQIEAQLSESWNKLEPLIEEYNKVHSELLKYQKQSAKLEQTLAPLRATVTIARTRVGLLASRYYKSGRTSDANALLISGSPAQFANQLMILEQMARTKQKQISDSTVAKSKFDGQRATLDKLIAATAKKDAELAKRKKVIEADVAKYQAQRRAAYGGNPPGGVLKLGKSCPAIALGMTGNKSSNGNAAALWACRQIGKRYVYNTNGPDTFDCSGLTQQAWKSVGVSLTHFTGAQWNEGTRVSASQAQVGDLVFFFSDLHHVGIYIGGGIMVHAPHTGDVVRMAYTKYMPVAGYVRPS